MTGHRPGILVVPAAQFGVAAADAFLSLLANGGSAVVGLPTGNTAIPFYAALRERAAGPGNPLGQVRRAFAIDEYVCARDHRAANRAFFAKHWSPIAGAPPVEQFEPEASDLPAEAARFGDLLAAVGGLDIAIVGIGRNGHLAFNDPPSGPATSTRVVELAAESRSAAASTFGPTVPRQGLTLGLSELLAAAHVLLLANGAAKAAIVERAFAGPVAESCPASFLQHHHSLTAVLDEPAASALPPSVQVFR